MGARRLRQAPFTIEELVALLLPTLGWDKSTELVDATIRQLDISPTELDVAGAIEVFETLSTQEGLVGVAARFIKMRLEQESKHISSVPVRVDRPAQSVRQPRAANTDASIAKSELIERFASALGTEKALALVEAAAELIGGVSGDRMSLTKA